MQDKYVILIDVDGTLVEPGKPSVSETVIESLKKAREKGHILSICTGRSIQTAREINGAEVFNYITCLMGSVVYSNDKQKVIYENDNKIDSNYIKPLIEYFISTNEEWTYKDDKQDKTTYLGVKKENRFNAKLVSARDVMQEIDNGVTIFQLLARDTIINEEIMNKYDKLDFIKMPGNYYDIVKKGLSKANAVKYFRSKFPDYKIVAIGDSNNDIPMLELADISICMANGEEHVRSIANFTTKSVLEDGVSYAINEILKI